MWDKYIPLRDESAQCSVPFSRRLRWNPGFPILCAGEMFPPKPLDFWKPFGGEKKCSCLQCLCHATKTTQEGEMWFISKAKWEGVSLNRKDVPNTRTFGKGVALVLLSMYLQRKVCK